VLRSGGPQSAGELVEQIAAIRRLRPATIATRLAELHADGLVLAAGYDDARRWSAAPVPRGPLAHLQLSGPHDLRHTFATWLEDAAIPARVIDELMGHAGGRHSERGSTIGRVYRHTTPEMCAAVVSALEERLAVTIKVAEEKAAQ
jgi:integrase